MKLVCISDTHGDHEQVDLPAGDVLIHAGDVTGHGTEYETRAFMTWFGSQSFAHKICVAGNHDTFMEQQPAKTIQFAEDAGVILLNDTGCEVGGLSFWGSPITPRFYNWSFMRDPGESIEAHWKLIPKHTDVLITHGPPFGILDQVERSAGIYEHTGCPSLLAQIAEVSPLLHVFGHIHEAHGQYDSHGVIYRNVSIMNERYRISNSPMIIALDVNKKGQQT